ncbi:MAG TPA: SDR family oxidoreductase [Gemmatimonadaceae bacterium]|nr:SDR family oxidoreductase [Gemmatimonadaceae bacterium]
MTFAMQGRVAVITGAGSGFGREFARLAASRGMKLVLADINQPTLDATLHELRDTGSEVIGVRTDVAVGEQVQALADATMARFGAVHLLFNNAGVASGGLVWESTPADWQWVLGANVWSVIHGVRIFTPLMLSHGEPAHIVNTASAAGLINAPNMGIYNVSKHAVVALSETLHHDLQLVKAKIGVSVLCPAFVPTGIAHSHRNRPAALMNDAPPTPSMLAAQQASVKAVESGRISAAEIAQMTFEAIDAGRFYIVPHTKILDSVSQRMTDIVARRNPSPMSGLTPDP